MTKILVERAVLEQLLDALEPCLEMEDGSIDVDVMNAMSQTRALLDEPSEPKYTTGHCANHAMKGGCQLHNLQCGYPACDRKEKP